MYRNGNVTPVFWFGRATTRRAVEHVGLLLVCLSFLLGFSACPEDNGDENDLYDPRNVTRIDDHIEAAPDIAVDSEGNVHIVYQGSLYEDPREVWYMFQNEKGKWSDPVNLSNSDNDSRVPQIAIDSQDNIHVIWEEDGEGQGRTMYSVKANNTDWTDPEYITENANPLPQLDVDANDDVHMMGMGAVYRKKSGGVWSDIEDIWYNDNPSMSVSDVGDVHIVRDVQPAPILYFYKLVGGEWSELIIVTDSEVYSWVPDVVVDSDGRVHVSWTEKFSDQIKLRTKIPDGTWSDIDSIPDMQGDPWKSKLAVDEYGLHVVWNAHTNEWDYDIYYQMRTHEGDWKERQQICLTQTPSLDPAIYLKDNVLYIAWIEILGETKRDNIDVYYETITIAEQ